jgi:hypothetical protein
MSGETRSIIGAVIVLWTLTIITGLLILNVGGYAVFIAYSTLTFPAWLIGYRMGQTDAYKEDSQ